MSTISLKILTLGRTYEKFFRNKDPALYFRETIFLKNDSNEIMFVMKEKRKETESLITEFESPEE